MIYYLDEYINWGTPNTKIEKEVSQKIEAIREKYFGAGKPNVVKFLDKRGVRVQNISGYYEPRKLFPLELRGGRGEWRFTDTMPSLDKNGRPIFMDSCKTFSHILYLHEEDIELIYFLLNHNNSVKNKRIIVIDDEEEAKKKVDELNDDLELRYYIYSKTNPVSIEALKDIASSFGIDTDALGANQVRNRLYDAIVDGDKGQHRFINTKIFMELINSEEKRKIANLVYWAIKHEDIKYSTKSFAWHFVQGGKLGDIILPVAGKDSSSAVQVLISKCWSDDEFRRTVYNYLGVPMNVMLDEYRKKTIIDLRNICKEKEIKHNNNHSKEQLIEWLCEHDGILYEKPVSESPL